MVPDPSAEAIEDAMKLLMSACLLVPLAACVAPEAAPAPRITAAPSPRAAATNTGAAFEDAPLPNYRMNAPAAESPIRVAR